MARRMRRRSSFRRLTKTKAEEFAREMKENYEENIKEHFSVIYLKKEKKYKLVDNLLAYIGKPDVNLVGNMTWKEVKERTGRDSIKVGGGYIIEWIDDRERKGLTEPLKQKIDTPIKVNGNYVDTPFRAKNKKV